MKFKVIDKPEVYFVPSAELASRIKHARSYNAPITIVLDDEYYAWEGGDILDLILEWQEDYEDCPPPAYYELDITATKLVLRGVDGGDLWYIPDLEIELEEV